MLTMAAGTAGAQPKPPGDAAAGGKLFAQRCQMCHSKEGAGGAAAPTLKGVYGGKPGTHGWPRYSPALQGASVTWNAASLDTYLQGPQKMIPGSRMMTMVPKPEDRRDIIAYLATLK